MVKLIKKWLLREYKTAEKQSRENIKWHAVGNGSMAACANDILACIKVKRHISAIEKFRKEKI